MNNIIKFPSPVDTDELIYDRKLQLQNSWKECPEKFLEILDSHHRETIDEMMDDLYVCIMTMDNVQDMAYNIKEFVDDLYDEYADDIANTEINPDADRLADMNRDD